MGIEEKIKVLEEKTRKVELGGGPEKQHKLGKLTARERLAKLLDPGSFIEISSFVTHHCTYFGMDKREAPGEGVVTGYGTINGRPVFVYAQDFTVMGGSVGKMSAYKICKVIDLAMEKGIPLIGLNDSAGARIQEGVDGLRAVGDIFYRNVMASGLIPQIVAVMGPCAGGSVYSPALMDFVIMVEKTSFMFITGPRVTEEVTGEKVTKEELGGADVHSRVSGVAHFSVKSEDECFKLIKKLLSYLPQNCNEEPPVAEDIQEPLPDPSKLNNVVPENPKKAYDIREIIKGVVDKDSFFEVHERFARNAVVGFARLNGGTVGVIANQPRVLAGVLDIDASDKISRFIRFCDAFNIPLITFVDMPGFLPGTDQESGGIIRHGAKIIFAYSEATVPKVTLIIRKAYGGGYISMCSRHLKADIVIAWPTAEIAVMGPEGAARILKRRELAEAGDPEKLIAEFAKEYRRTFANPYMPASLGYVDLIIKPEDTRKVLVKVLEFLKGKKKGFTELPRKHRNMPV